LTGEPLGTTGGATISAGRYDSDGLEDLVIAGGSDSGSITAVYSGRTDLASAQLLQRYAAFADIAGSSPVFSTGVDINGDGRIDEIFSFQGAGGTVGTRVFDPAGNLTEVVTVLRGPLERGAQAHLTGSASYGPQAIPLITTASGLQYRDLLVGAGAPAAAGQTVTVHYVGSRQNGELFDSSRTRGTPFTFTLGTGQVIAGWDEGVAGMRVGGRRTLIIPANLAYGDTPPGSVIQPGDTLVFDVELLSAS
jgi:peptidylprolyl isomerase